MEPASKRIKVEQPQMSLQVHPHQIFNGLPIGALPPPEVLLTRISALEAQLDERQGIINVLQKEVRKQPLR